jgi:predicted AAA+ superfamily ATPase
MKRLYDKILADHIRKLRQMAFVSGPRQVGKTTTCRAAGTVYFDWDADAHRRLIVQGASAIAAETGLDSVSKERPILIFDELHKYPRWKNFLKGLFDLHEKHCRIVDTGSSRLDVYRRGGDSLMGRYFPFRMHPLSVGELLSTRLPDKHLVRSPKYLGEEIFEALWQH